MTSISGTARATECRVRDAGPHRAQRGRASTRRSARARVPPSDRESTSRPRERGCGALQLLRHHADDDKRFFSGPTPRDSYVSLDEIIRCAPRPLRSAAATRRRCSVTFSAVPAAKAAAKPRSPRPVRVPRALVGVIAARGTTFRARSARFVPRHGRSRAFSRDAATPTELPSRHGTDPVFALPPRTPQASAPGLTAAAASGASAAPRASAGASGVRSPARISPRGLENE